MAKNRKLTPEELAERLKREREFRKLLERRRELDRAARRPTRAANHLGSTGL